LRTHHERHCCFSLILAQNILLSQKEKFGSRRIKTNRVDCGFESSIEAIECVLVRRFSSSWSQKSWHRQSHAFVKIDGRAHPHRQRLIFGLYFSHFRHPATARNRFRWVPNFEKNSPKFSWTHSTQILAISGRVSADFSSDFRAHGTDLTVGKSCRLLHTAFHVEMY
jgi:hypothetical protein